MKKQNLLSFALMCIGVFASGLYGPWYAPAGFILVFTAVLKHERPAALLNGLLACTVVFAAMSVRMLTKDTSGLIEKTGNLLGGLSPVLMVIITTVIGGITGLVSGWLGHTIGEIFRSTSK